MHLPLHTHTHTDDKQAFTHTVKVALLAEGWSTWSEVKAALGRPKREHATPTTLPRLQGGEGHLADHEAVPFPD